MTSKIIISAVLSALVAFGTGTYVGYNRTAAPPPASAEDSESARTITALQQDNVRLKSEVSVLQTDISRLKDEAAALTESHAPPPAPAPGPAPKGLTLGLSRGELQQSMLNNLRQIDAARQQFLHDNGRPPNSVYDLVGRKSYIKTVRSMDGEDYSGLSMVDGAPLTVSTPDGLSVTYDPAGTMTTQPELSPEMLRLQEMERRIQAPANKAMAAYRAANNGNIPANEQALLPYFATPAEGADFLEFVEAQKAASR